MFASVQVPTFPNTEHENRQTACKGVDGHTDDEFIALQLYNKQRKEESHQNTHKDCGENAHRRADKHKAEYNGKESAHKDHTFHTDIHNAGVFSKQTAQGCKKYRSCSSHVLIPFSAAIRKMMMEKIIS